MPTTSPSSGATPLATRGKRRLSASPGKGRFLRKRPNGRATKSCCLGRTVPACGAPSGRLCCPRSLVDTAVAASSPESSTPVTLTSYVKKRKSVVSICGGRKSLLRLSCGGDAWRRLPSVGTEQSPFVELDRGDFSVRQDVNDDAPLRRVEQVDARGIGTLAGALGAQRVVFVGGHERCAGQR